jgi:hypothetical protein
VIGLHWLYVVEASIPHHVLYQVLINYRPHFTGKGERRMKWNTKIVLEIVALGAAMVACQAVTGGGNNAAVPPVNTDSSGISTQPSTGNVLLSDDFSSKRWGMGTNSDSSTEYENGALRMIVYTKNLFVWSTPPNNQDYQNIHMEVTVNNNGTDSTTAFGLMCNQQASAKSSYYYFAITPAGQYAIAKASEGHRDIILTNNDQFAVSDLIKQDAPSYRVGADCSSNGTLTLYVDGQQIISASDVSYTSGGVAVITWSGEEATKTDVSFDDFLMMQLQ